MSILDDLMKAGVLDADQAAFLEKNPELLERSAETLSKSGDEILGSSIDTRLTDESLKALSAGAPDSPSKDFIDSSPFSRARKANVLDRMNSPGAAAQARFRLRQDAMAAADDVAGPPGIPQDIAATPETVSPAEAFTGGPEALNESALSAFGAEVSGTLDDATLVDSAAEGTYGTDLAGLNQPQFGQADAFNDVVSQMGAQIDVDSPAGLEADMTFQPEITIPEPEIDMDLSGGFGGFNSATGGGLQGFFGL